MPKSVNFRRNIEVLTSLQSLTASEQSIRMLEGFKSLRKFIWKRNKIFKCFFFKCKCFRLCVVLYSYIIFMKACSMQAMWWCNKKNTSAACLYIFVAIVIVIAAAVAFDAVSLILQ